MLTNVFCHFLRFYVFFNFKLNVFLHLRFILRILVLCASGPPRWRDGRPPQSIVAAEEESVELACRTDGQPPPTVTWSINGQPVPGSLAQNTVQYIALFTNSGSKVSINEFVLINY